MVNKAKKAMMCLLDVIDWIGEKPFPFCKSFCLNDVGENVCRGLCPVYVPKYWDVEAMEQYSEEILGKERAEVDEKLSFCLRYLGGVLLYYLTLHLTFLTAVEATGLLRIPSVGESIIEWIPCVALGGAILLPLVAILWYQGIMEVPQKEKREDVCLRIFGE